MPVLIYQSPDGGIQLTLSTHNALKMQPDGQPEQVQTAANCNYEQLCPGFVRLYTSQNAATTALIAIGVHYAIRVLKTYLCADPDNTQYAY